MKKFCYSWWSGLTCSLWECDETPGLVPVPRVFGSGFPDSSRTRSNLRIRPRLGLGLGQASDQATSRSWTRSHSKSWSRLVWCQHQIFLFVDLGCQIFLPLSAGTKSSELIHCVGDYSLGDSLVWGAQVLSSRIVFQAYFQYTMSPKKRTSSEILFTRRLDLLRIFVPRLRTSSAIFV